MGFEDDWQRENVQNISYENVCPLVFFQPFFPTLIFTKIIIACLLFD
jgi:hypothetical protein